VSRFKLNWDLVSKDLDPETSQIIETVRTNVDSVVDDTVTALESEIRKRIASFSEGAYDEELSAAAEEIATQIKADFAPLNEASKKLKEASEHLASIISTAKPAELKAAAESLVAASSETTTKINSQVKNVENFGNNAGKFITGKALGFLSAGLLG